jgi:hypothetical protein
MLDFEFKLLYFTKVFLVIDSKHLIFFEDIPLLLKLLDLGIERNDCIFFRSGLLF